MTAPDWLSVGTTLVDPDGDEWLVRAVSGGTVAVQNPDRGVHRLRRADLVTWVERGGWSVLE